MALRMSEIVGGGYTDYWNFKGRYRVCKGSRASKKSKTTALYFITKLMKHKLANLLVVRKVFHTLKDSCFKELVCVIFLNFFYNLQGKVESAVIHSDENACKA